MGVLGEDCITYFGGYEFVSTFMLCFSLAPVLIVAIGIVGHGVNGLINHHHQGAGTVAFMIAVIILGILTPPVLLVSLSKWSRWRLAQFERLVVAFPSASEPRLGLV